MWALTLCTLIVQPRWVTRLCMAQNGSHRSSMLPWPGLGHDERHEQPPGYQSASPASHAPLNHIVKNYVVCRKSEFSKGNIFYIEMLAFAKKSLFM